MSEEDMTIRNADVPEDLAELAIALEDVAVATKNLIPLFGALAAAASAFAAGVYLAKRKYEKKYAELAEQEIKEAKLFYANMQKPDPATLVAQKGYAKAETINNVVTNLRDLTKNYRSDADVVREDNDEDAVIRNILESDPDAPIWDYKAEEAARDKDKPYIISQSEFLENEPEHEQQTITYYEKDEVLTDQREEVLNNEEQLIGEDNLRFGHGSADPNIVYVRNELMSVDFEVLRSTGAYAHEVLGFEHSDDSRRRARKFRPNDE